MQHIDAGYQRELRKNILLDAFVHEHDLKKLEEYLDTEEKAVDAMDILGLPVPLTPLPISPGRNVAVLVEVAVRNFRLKHMGFDSEREFELKLK